MSKEAAKSLDAKKKYIEGRPKFWRSGNAPVQLDGTFEILMKYAGSRAKEPSFQRALEVLKLKKAERILDFGAGICWSTYAFSNLGCDSVAVDFDASNISGLTAAKKIREKSPYFHIVRADFERMPFKDKIFDVAFCAQVLHHSEDLCGLICEVARVTKGIVIAIGEPKRGLFQSEKKLIRAMNTVNYGANEHFPSYFTYIAAFRKSGLTNIEMFPSKGGWASIGEKGSRGHDPLKRVFISIFRMSLATSTLGRVMQKFHLIFLLSYITIVARKSSNK